jgi:tripeptide aminopeptidase
MNEKYPDLLNNFVNYVKFNTMSNPDSDKTPSSKGQWDFMKHLVKELENIGLTWVIKGTNHCYLYGFLECNYEREEKMDSIGFVAHIDTSPEEPGINVKPKIFTYHGGTIDISGDGRIKLEPELHPYLKDKIGKTLITASGDTLLGADDKAGVAEIISALKYLKNNPCIKHGDIYLAFTPDEEIGHGTKYFDTAIFKPDFAFTMDGAEIGIYESENFNAINGKIKITGFNTHPGNAYKKMVNSIRVMGYFISLLQEEDTPENTRDREGFIHFDKINGSVNEVKVDFIMRDFTRPGLENLKQLLFEIKNKVQERFPKSNIDIDFLEIYENMKRIIDKHPHIEKRVYSAAKNLGIELKKIGIRGGTDGARLSFMGIPTPNLFTGGYNYHSKYEFAILEEMEMATSLIIEIVREVNG